MIVDHICVNFGAALFHELFNELHERGVKQNVFYPRNRTHLEATGSRAYGIDSPLILDITTKISFIRKQRCMRKHYDPLFKRNNPDLIHAHTLFSDGSLANYYHMQYGTPFIVGIRSSDMDVFLKYKPWLFSVAKQTVENASGLVFISPALKKKFLGKFGDRYESKSMILANGIPASYFQNTASVKKVVHDPPELLYVGSFLKRKKVPSLIKLAKETGARLSIVGQGGAQQKKALRMVRDSDKITYLGRIGDTFRLMEIYRQSDIFIMTSKRETFGLVYLEAMSQGLPLIYSRNTGIDGLFEEGIVGYPVKPASISEMQKAIEKILVNYAEISGKCISEARKFQWSSIVNGYLDLYNSVRL